MNAQSILLGIGNNSRNPQATAPEAQNDAATNDQTFLSLMAQALNVPLNLFPQAAPPMNGNTGPQGGDQQACPAASPALENRLPVVPGEGQQNAPGAASAEKQDVMALFGKDAGGAALEEKKVTVPASSEPLFDGVKNRAALPENQAKLQTEDALPEQTRVLNQEELRRAPSDRGSHTLTVLQQHQQQAVPAGAAVSRPAEHAGVPRTPLTGAEGPHAFDDAVLIARDGNRLAVTLEPDGFGKMNLHLTLDKGVVNAQLQVADDGLRNLLGNNIQQLLDALAREGVSVGGFSISLRNEGSDGEHRASAEPGRRAGSGDGADSPAAMSSSPGAAGLVSVFA